jgi:hypothetical protein
MTHLMTEQNDKTESSYDWEIAVKVRGIGIGDETVRFGFEFVAGEIDLNAQKELFVGSQLDCKIVHDPNADKDANGQQVMEDCAGQDVLVGVAVSRRLGLGVETHGGSLQFQLSAIDTSRLGRFAKKKCTLFCTRLGDATDISGPDDAEDEG